jgi:hypothetical protein
MASSARSQSANYTPTMRFNLKSASILVAVVGCVLFPFGGFMLLPVALDMWEHHSGKNATA